MAFKFNSETDYGQTPDIKFILRPETFVVTTSESTLLLFINDTSNPWVHQVDGDIIFKRSGQYYIRTYIGGELANGPNSRITTSIYISNEGVVPFDTPYVSLKNMVFDLGVGDPKLRFIECTASQYIRGGEIAQIYVDTSEQTFNVENRDTNLTYVEILFCSP